MTYTADHKRYDFRRLIGRFATGVAVVLTSDDGVAAGLTVNSLTSLSLDPLLLLFCASTESRSATTILRTGHFSVNVLSAAQQHVSRHFAGQQAGHQAMTFESQGGWVFLPDSNASFLCSVDRVYPGGDHTIIVGRVAHTLGPERPVQPLLYYGGGYARLPMDEISG